MTEPVDPPIAGQTITGSWMQTLQEPPIAIIAVQYLNQLNLGNYPIGTRLPGPDDDPATVQQITVSGFVRAEQLQIVPVNELEFDCDWVLSVYHPDDKTAQRINSKATSWCANAQGTRIHVPQYTEDDGTVVPAATWYVGWSRAPIRGQRREDPTVELPRFRSMLTWRVPGHVLVGV